MFEAAAWHMFNSFELGARLAETDRGLRARADELREPFMRYVAASSRTMHALFEGRFDDAERLSQRTLDIGDRMPGLDAAGVYGVQMFTLRREQGRLDEVAPLVEQFVRTHAQSTVWRSGLALIYAELGSTNRTEAAAFAIRHAMHTQANPGGG